MNHNLFNAPRVILILDIMSSEHVVTDEGTKRETEVNGRLLMASKIRWSTLIMGDTVVSLQHAGGR
jgi:hypothetical protein